MFPREVSPEASSTFHPVASSLEPPPARHSAPETLFSSAGDGSDGGAAAGSRKPKSPRFREPAPQLRVNPTEYAARRKRARDNASRIKREALEKSADGLTFSPNLNLSQRGKGKGEETNAYSQMPVLNLTEGDWDEEGDDVVVDDSRREEKKGDEERMSSTVVADHLQRKNMSMKKTTKKKEIPPSPGRKNRMGLLLCKRKLRAAAAAAASSSQAGTISFAQLFRPFVKSYSMESRLDMRAFVSLVRGAGKIPKSMLANAELEAIFQSELLSRCKPGASGVSLGLVKAWVIDGQEDEREDLAPQLHSKKPSKLTPPTVKRSSLRSRQAAAAADKLRSEAEKDAPRGAKSAVSLNVHVAMASPSDAPPHVGSAAIRGVF
jgi:hypothetical protein